MSLKRLRIKCVISCVRLRGDTLATQSPARIIPFALILFRAYLSFSLEYSLEQNAPTYSRIVSDESEASLINDGPFEFRRIERSFWSSAPVRIK